jgi:hypothetical protein
MDDDFRSLSLYTFEANASNNDFSTKTRQRPRISMSLVEGIAMNTSSTENKVERCVCRGTKSGVELQAPIIHWQTQVGLQ